MLNQNVPDCQVRFRVRGLVFDGLLELCHGLGRFSLDDERRSEIVVRVGIIGPEPERCAKIVRRFIDTSLTRESRAEIVGEQRLVRLRAQRRREVGGRFAGLALMQDPYLMLPPQIASLQVPLVALIVTALAVVFDWVAFGPGERRFSGSLGMPGMAVSGAAGELTGRLFFGLFAVLFDLAALGLWIQYVRLFFRAKAPLDHG